MGFIAALMVGGLWLLEDDGMPEAVIVLGSMFLLCTLLVFVDDLVVTMLAIPEADD